MFERLMNFFKKSDENVVKNEKRFKPDLDDTMLFAEERRFKEVLIFDIINYVNRRISTSKSNDKRYVRSRIIKTINDAKVYLDLISKYSEFSKSLNNNSSVMVIFNNANDYLNALDDIIHNDKTWKTIHDRRKELSKKFGF